MTSWSTVELRNARIMRDQGAKYREIAEALGSRRTPNAIKRKLQAPCKTCVVGLTSVGYNLHAFHVPPYNKEPAHSHDWEIVAWFYDYGNDAESLQQRLVDIMGPYAGKLLPSELSRAEALAQFVYEKLSCAYVVVSRHAEKLYAKYPA